jgi:hypothetical protein
MALADDLLSQAHTLATLDTGIPSQANLRRAVSSAYYALFHLLISEAVAVLLPASPPGLRERASRAFSHAEMKKVCARFTARQLADDLAPLLKGRLSPELLSVAEIFESLQDWRHIADYDVSFSFTRSDALSAIDESRQAFADWNAIRDTDEATVFLAALAFGARWSK